MYGFCGIKSKSPFEGVSISPDCIAHRPLIALSKDVLPQPEGPTTSKLWPVSRLRFKLLIR